MQYMWSTLNTNVAIANLPQNVCLLVACSNSIELLRDI